MTHPAKYREPFEPLVPGVEFVRFNDVADLEAKFDDSVCAIVVEAIQGEGGIYPMSGPFWTRARELASHYGAALIADEIQCGLGRTGRPFGYQRHVGLPDIVVVAKAAGGRAAAGRDSGAGEFRRSVFAGPARLDLRRRAAGVRGGAGISGDRRGRKSAGERARARRAIARRAFAAGSGIRFRSRGARRRPDVGMDLAVEGRPYVDAALRQRADHQLHARARASAAAAVYRERAAGGRVPDAFARRISRRPSGREQRPEDRRGGFAARAGGCEVNRDDQMTTISVPLALPPICSPAPNGARAVRELYQLAAE